LKLDGNFIIDKIFQVDNKKDRNLDLEILNKKIIKKNKFK